MAIDPRNSLISSRHGIHLKKALGRVLRGAGCFVLQPAHLGTLAAVDFVTSAGFAMMRQDEPSVRTVILVMVNPPVRSGMILQIGMEGSNLRHLLLLRSGVITGVS